MTYTVQWTIEPAVFDSDSVETDYTKYEIVKTVSTEKSWTCLLPADSVYYTPPMVDDSLVGLELISDQAINLKIATSTGGTRFIFTSIKNMLLSALITNTSTNTWSIMQSTGATAANVIWRTYSST